jgi:sodium-dependent dicarboxylate transporter 2/3/5
MVLASIMPLLKSMDKNSGISKAFLLGIPLAAATGGMATVIGTPTNAIAVGLLSNAGINIDFIEWMKFGVPISLVLTAISCYALIRIYIKDKTPLSLDFLDSQMSDKSQVNLTQRRIVVGIILVTVGLWLTTSLHGLTVASICAVPLVFLTLTGVLEAKDIRSLPWDTLLLVAGGLSLGLALEQTGLLTHYSQMLINMEVNTMVLIFIFAFLTMLVSNIMSNTAASTVMIPLGMTILIAFKSEIALIIAFAASSAMFLPVSTPPNAIAYSTGMLEQKDFRLGGILIGILGPLLAILWVLVIS